MKIKKTKIKIKYLALGLLCGLQLCLSPPITSHAAPAWPSYETPIDAKSGIVVDADSGAVLFEKNADELYPPASITKLLTALLVLEKCDNLDDVITFSSEAVRPVEDDSGNKLNVAAGDQLTVRDCLYFMLLESSNETANALAEYVAGDMDSFVVLMNNKVKELGLTKTSFTNPSGLNGDTQRVTAREMAVIAEAACSIPALQEINSTASYELPPMTNTPNGSKLTNENWFITRNTPDNIYYLPGMKAGKTGFLKAAGNTLVTYTDRDGKRLISVILQGSRGPEHPRQYFMDAKNTLLFGYDNFTNYKLADHDKEPFTEADTATLQASGLDVSNLTIRDDGVLSLPNGATFADVTRTLSTDLPAGHPENAAAIFRYTYEGRDAGFTYIDENKTQPAAAALPGDQAEAETIPTATPDNLPGDPPDKKPINIFAIAVMIIIVMIAAMAVRLYINHKREVKRMEERRRNRRARLEELGISREEFEQMVESRRQRHDPPES